MRQWIKLPKRAAPAAFVLPWLTVSCSGEDAATIAQRDAIIGVWALAETGCATGYGAAYTVGGRFAEGDEAGGVEGQWTIGNGELVRQSELRFSADEDDWFAEPSVETVKETQRFSLVKLDASELAFRDDQGRQFSYVRCRDGQRTFLDGEVAKHDIGSRKVEAADFAQSTTERQSGIQHAFDLVCADQTRNEFRMRFDLQQRKWCPDECPSVWHIDDLSDGAIKLSLANINGSERRIININRYTSEFWIERVGYGKDPAFWGQCRVEDFSGFPQRSF